MVTATYPQSKPAHWPPPPARTYRPFHHDGDHPVAVEVLAQGDLFKVRKARLVLRSHERRGQGTQRGYITHFSDRSRKRLLDRFATLDRKRLYGRRKRLRFITLTYGANVTDGPRVKRDLDAFAKRLARLDPGCWFFWRLERQKRGAYHLHLLGELRYTPVEALQAAWSDVTGETHTNTLDLETVRSWRGAMAYAAKYLAKREPLEEPEPALGLSVCQNSPQTTQPQLPGRFWGIIGRNNAPWAKRTSLRLVMTLRSWAGWCWENPSPWATPAQGCTIYGDSAAELRSLRAAWAADGVNNAIFTFWARKMSDLWRVDELRIHESWIALAKHRRTSVP